MRARSIVIVFCSKYTLYLCLQDFDAFVVSIYLFCVLCSHLCLCSHVSDLVINKLRNMVLLHRVPDNTFVYVVCRPYVVSCALAITCIGLILDEKAN